MSCGQYGRREVKQVLVAHLAAIGAAHRFVFRLRHLLRQLLGVMPSWPSPASETLMPTSRSSRSKAPGRRRASAASPMAARPRRRPHRYPRRSTPASRASQARRRGRDARVAVRPVHGRCCARSPCRNCRCRCRPMLRPTAAPRVQSDPLASSRPAADAGPPGGSPDGSTGRWPDWHCGWWRPRWHAPAHRCRSPRSGARADRWSAPDRAGLHRP